MDPKKHSGPGIMIPPPVIYVSALLIGIGLNFLWPTSPLPAVWAFAAGAALILASVLITPPALLRFRRAGTTIDVRKAASTLITDGPYRFSRNPLYVALTLLFVGLGVIFNNAWILILVVPVFLVMNVWVVRREETHLEAQFGEAYRRYKSAVRRWL
jgi:protein-S-isoprenylcysteine O-methyltransferase Ste14